MRYSNLGVHHFRNGPLANTDMSGFAGPAPWIDNETGKPAEVEWRGLEWFFQAWKIRDPATSYRIWQATAWRAAKALGQAPAPMRSGWDVGPLPSCAQDIDDDKTVQGRVRTMYAGMRFKFKQHGLAASALLETGHKTIVEDLPDPFWGMGADNAGENWTGRLLMWVRSEIEPQEEIPF